MSVRPNSRSMDGRTTRHNQNTINTDGRTDGVGPHYYTDGPHLGNRTVESLYVQN